MKSEFNKNISLVVIVLALVSLSYVTYRAMTIVQKRQISTGDGIYENRVTSNQEIVDLAVRLTEKCDDDLCRAQSLLDYVTNIPYKTSRFQRNSPQHTIQLNYGDCDDKSNLLISMLHSLGIEAYFVLVPKHIFVISPISDKRLNNAHTLLLDGRKYYILESTAKDSRVGFPFRYRSDEIEIIIEPFSNKKLKYEKIEFLLE